MSDALAAANQMRGRGDFDGSLQTYRSVAAAAAKKPPGDAALYNMGLVYAHPENPQRDLSKARASFSQVVKAYPDSPWAESAKVWIGLLRESEEAQRDIEESRLAIEKSRQELERNRQAMERSKREIERSRLELERIKREIEQTRQVIEKSRQVDIEIDQKRRDRGR